MSIDAVLEVVMNDHLAVLIEAVMSDHLAVLIEAVMNDHLAVLIEVVMNDHLAVLIEVVMNDHLAVLIEAVMPDHLAVLIEALASDHLAQQDCLINLVAQKRKNDCSVDDFAVLVVVHDSLGIDVVVLVYGYLANVVLRNCLAVVIRLRQFLL